MQRKFFSAKWSAVFLAGIAMAQAQTVTFTGSQRTVVSGAIDSGLAADAAGNIYYASLNGIFATIVKLSPDGARTNLISNFNFNYGIAVDQSGNVYASNVGQGLIVKIDSGGTHVVASGFSTFVGGIALDPAGNLWATDTANFQGRVVRLAPDGSQTTFTGFRYPQGIAADQAGNVYVADGDTLKVTKLSPDGSRTNVGGPYTLPGGVAVDSSGNVFVADSGAAKIIRIAPDGTQTTVMQGIVARNVAVDGSGNIIAADVGGNRIVALSQSSPAGTANVCYFGHTTPAPCSQTVHLVYNVVTGGTLGAARALTLGQPNKDFTLANNTCQGNLISGSSCSVDVTFRPQAPGLSRGAIQLTDAAGRPLATTYIYGNGVSPLLVSKLGLPVQYASVPGTFDLTTDSSSNLFVAATGAVAKIAPGGTASTLAQASFATGIAIDGAGNLLVADRNSGSVSKILPDGTQVSLGQNLDSPAAIAVDEAGEVYVATATKLVKIAANGTQATLASLPSSVRKLAFGPDRILYLADSNQGVLRFAAGSLSVVSNQQASGLAIDAAGSFYVTGASTNELYKFAADGTILATIPLSFAPVAVAIDGSGIVSVADSSGAIWQLRRSQETITFENTLVGSTSTDSPKALIFDNIGNAASTLTYAQPDRTNDFIAVPGSGSPVDCVAGLVIAPGGSCIELIAFKPTRTGLLRALTGISGRYLGHTSNAVALLQGTGVAAQTITFTGLPATATFGAGPYTLNATASSGLPVSYTVTGPATISGSTLTITGAGTVAVTASQAGDATYTAATPVSLTIVVSPAGQTITFTGLPATATFGAGPYTLNATASSGLPVSYTVTGPAAISGSALAITGAGTVAVTASQPGNGNYAAATPVTLTIVVSPASQSITFAAIPAQNVGASVTLSASASSGLPVSYTSSTTAVCTVSGNTATMIAAGTCSIRATQAGNGQYAAATPVTQSFSVTAVTTADFTIRPIPSVQNLVLGNITAFALELKSVQNFNGNVTLSCSGGPAGSKCANLPQTVRVNGTALAVSGILFPKGTPKGTYTMTFTGVSGSLSHSATAQFVVK